MVLRAGDCLCLRGEIGMGKSSLARAIIRHLAGDAALDVPSPTFTLVQHYDLTLPVDHLDLYRLSNPHELDELGLDAALESGIALIEWPEKAAGLLPDKRMTVTLRESIGGHMAEITGPPDRMAALKRSLTIRAFLKKAGHGKAERRPLTGDASSRRYESVTTPPQIPLVLMDAPSPPPGPLVQDGRSYAEIAHITTDIAPFVALSCHLRSMGLCAPAIHAYDGEAGLVLMEDLGRKGVVDDDGAPLEERYRIALDCLLRLHHAPVPGPLPMPKSDASTATTPENYTVAHFDADAMLIEVSLFIDWYMPHAAGHGPDARKRQDFHEIWRHLIDLLATSEKKLLLRDFHSPNLIWRDTRQGTDRIGILDFQDAMIGPTAYDVASLLHDARVTVEPDLQTRLLDHYCDARAAEPTFDAAVFRQDLAIMQAQRAMKILGIFVRLDKRDGKPAYLALLPRVRDYLDQALDHPALHPLRKWCRSVGVFDDHNNA